MAQDQVDVMQSHGFKQFSVAGHDLGDGSLRSLTPDVFAVANQKAIC
jgi:hypothetical protein